MGKSFLLEKQSEFNKASETAIDTLLYELKKPIDLEELKDNKLKIACEGKVQAFSSVSSILSNSSITKSKKEETILALKCAWEEMRKISTIKREDIKDDDIKSVSSAISMANLNMSTFAIKIDELMEDEDLKRNRIDKYKPESIVERYIKING